MCSDHIVRPVFSSKAPAAIGPYSHAYQAGDFLYTSGQIPIDPVTNKLIDGTIKEQTRHVLDNLAAVLESAGLDLQSVIKTTVFITDITEFPQVNAVYAEYFIKNPPARSCVQVEALPAGAKVEIEAVAYYANGH